jgi:hypothetical protein
MGYAVAGLHVVFLHAGLGFSPRLLPGWARNLQRCLSFGHDAVAFSSSCPVIA